MFNRFKNQFRTCITSPALNRAGSAAFFLTRGKNTGSIRNANRILVLKPDGIGDVILATGFMRSLRRQCPKAHITIAVKQHAKELVENACFGDEVLVWDEEWHYYAEPKSVVSLAKSAHRKWKGSPPDWVLIPRSGWDCANASIYAWWSGSANICAHKFFCEDHGLNRHGFVNRLISNGEIVHETEFHRRMLKFLSLEGEIRPQLEIAPSIKKKVDEFVAGMGKPRMAFGIGGSHDSKRWPAQHFKSLAHSVLAKWPGTKIFLVGGKEDQEMARLINDGLSAVVDVTGKLSVLETAALLGHCEVYVGNNSGPIHLAGASGCAVVEISKHPVSASPVHECSPVRFGTIAAWNHILQPEALKAECREGCNEAHAHCIASITVDRVVEGVQEALNSTRNVKAA